MVTKPTPTKTATRPTLVSKDAKPLIVNLDEAPGQDAGAPVAKGDGTLKLKALVDRVTAASGVRRKDVKTVVEATLTQLVEALARGEAMNLPGLGHMRVARKATPKVPTMTLKLRQGDAGKGRAAQADGSTEADDKEPLAEDSDQG